MQLTFFQRICSDEPFWKNKLERDFNFSPTATARQSRSKLIYQGLRRPHLFVWGANTAPSTQPEIIPILQYQSIISVVTGDYHHGVLTSTGKLLTWGSYSSGALGLGYKPNIATSMFQQRCIGHRARNLGRRRKVADSVVRPGEKTASGVGRRSVGALKKWP
ncbi:hypothetical protein AB1N83_000676 [Pleurotus pulmonarius]